MVRLIKNGPLPAAILLRRTCGSGSDLPRCAVEVTEPDDLCEVELPVLDLRSQRFRFLLIFLLIHLMVEPGTRPAADEPEVLHRQRPESRWVDIREPALRESSGLGYSGREPNRFWSHNDSGGLAHLFAFGPAGQPTGFCNLVGAPSRDWEDMACFRQNGIPRILVADCGDNQRRRSSIQLYLFDEPDPDQRSDIRKYKTIQLTFPDGPHDCEAIAVDVAREKIILIAKTAFPLAGIYSIELPVSTNDSVQSIQSPTEVTATRIGTLAVPMVSAMDLHEASGDIWVVNYFQAFRFPCVNRDEPIATQLGKNPKAYPLPKLKANRSGRGRRQTQHLADKRRVADTVRQAKKVTGRIA